MDFDYVKVFVTVVLAVFGWISAHYFTSRRDVNNSRREISIEHLVRAYRVLANDVSHRELNEERRKALEVLLSDIQLFGSPEQVHLAKTLAGTVAAGKSFELDPLINSLRDDLRSQLQLKRIPGNLRWLRFQGAGRRRESA